jgi:hypothetical protein
VARAAPDRHDSRIFTLDRAGIATSTVANHMDLRQFVAAARLPGTAT